MGNTPKKIFEDALKKTEPHRFPEVACPHKECLRQDCSQAMTCKAFQFWVGAYQHALNKCNVFVPPKGLTPLERQAALNKLINANGVRMTFNRGFFYDFTSMKEEWWTVCFVYKNEDIVAFISYPKMEKPSRGSTFIEPALTVRTNVVM